MPISRLRKSKPKHRATPVKRGSHLNGTKLLTGGLLALVAATGTAGSAPLNESAETFATKDRVAETSAVSFPELDRVAFSQPAPVVVKSNAKSSKVILERAEFTAKPKPTPQEKRATSLIADTGVATIESNTTTISTSNGIEKIQNAKTSKWVLPINSYRISSPFGHRGAIPAAGVSAGLHNGVDFSAPFGTPIKASFAGKVVHVGFTDFDTHTGGIVVILHETAGGSWLTSYNHMSPSGINVKEGDIVESGEVIAKVASEGLSSGPHLHFSVRKVTGPDVLKDWEIMEPLQFLRDQGLKP